MEQSTISMVIFQFTMAQYRSPRCPGPASQAQGAAQGGTAHVQHRHSGARLDVIEVEEILHLTIWLFNIAMENPL